MRAEIIVCDVCGKLMPKSIGYQIPLKGNTSMPLMLKGTAGKCGRGSRYKEADICIKCIKKSLLKIMTNTSGKWKLLFSSQESRHISR